MTSSKVVEYAPGDVVGGKYLLVAEIGAGGMGTVWAARNNATDAEVALKIWRDDGRDADAENTRSRFRNEAKLSAMLAHRNVVRVFDLLTEPDGTLVLVMERLRGCSLASYLKTYGKIDEYAVMAIAVGLLAALDQAHHAGIVHRDMKPANVFLAVEADGHVTPKLLDFGIAKVPSANTSLTLDGSVLGTPRYMSPEQIRSKEIDGRSDLFSLSTVLYEALTGVSPFEADTAGAALAMVLEVAVDPDPSLSPQLWNVLSRGLAKKPYERPATAAEFSAALRATCPATDSELDQSLRALNIAAVAEEPVVIPALPTSFERGKKRTKIPLYLGLAGVFMLAVTVGVTLGRRPSEPNETSRTTNAGGGGASSVSAGSGNAGGSGGTQASNTQGTGTQGTGAQGTGAQGTQTAGTQRAADPSSIELSNPSGSDTGAWGAMPQMTGGQTTTTGGGGKPNIRRPIPATTGSGKRPVATTPGF